MRHERGGGADEVRWPVLLITLDTTRADHLEPYGAGRVETPALASLAASGVVFERAFATAPVTAPAHASLLTGLYSPRHGVRDNSTHHLDAELTTLAERLSAAGYRTAAFVSTAILDHCYGLDQGFDVYDDDIRSRAADDDRRLTVERPADATTDRALAWLDALPPDEPFFVWVHFYDPHIPYSPPSPWSERYRDDAYAGEIAFMDSQVARLLGHPRIAAEGTIVTAIGDHGESLGEHGERTHGLLVYDSTLHVPWILRAPGLPPGLRLASPVSQVDLLPTMTQLLGLAAATEADPLDGISLAPVLAGGAPDPERPIFAESEAPFFAYGWSPLRAVRQDGLKLVDAPVAELYDLARDPGELDNLAPSRSDPVDRLTATVRAWAEGGRRSDGAVAVDARTTAALRALGYVAGEPERPQDSGRGNPVELMPVHDELQAVGRLLAEGRPREAVERVRGALAQDPDNLIGLRDLGRGLVLLGRLEEAAEVAARATALAPWSAQAAAIEADVEFRRGRFGRALELLDRALALDPNLLGARVDRARTLAALGRTDEATTAIASLLREAPDDNWVALRHAELVELPAGDIDGAERRMRTVLSRNPSFVEAWLLLGEVLRRADRSEDALAAYREAAAASPARAAEVNNARATLLLELGRPAEAEAVWQALLRDHPDFTPASINLASLLLRRQDLVGAESLARSAIAREPASAGAWNTLAVALDQLGGRREAEAAYRRSAELDLADWRALFNLGILLRTGARYREAVAVQERVLERSPGNPGAHFELGMLWAGFLGDPARARGHLQAVIDADPNHPRARQARVVLDRLSSAP